MPTESDNSKKNSKLERKVRLLNSPEDIQTIIKINEYMAQVRIDYIYKSKRSEYFS